MVFSGYFSISAVPEPTGAKSRGKKERSEQFGNTRTVETVEQALATECPVCGEDLWKEKCHRHERRTKIDIIFEKVVKHVDAEIKECPACGKEVKGEFPADMPGPLQYGDGLKAWLINLVVVQMIALQRACALWVAPFA